MTAVHVNVFDRRQMQIVRSDHGARISRRRFASQQQRIGAAPLHPRFTPPRAGKILVLSDTGRKKKNMIVAKNKGEKTVTAEIQIPVPRRVFWQGAEKWQMQRFEGSGQRE